MIETLRQDLRYALRTLWAKPGFTLIVTVALALGIGANATIFTWIKAVLLESLPGIQRPEEQAHSPDSCDELDFHFSSSAPPELNQNSCCRKPRPNRARFWS